MLRYNLNAVFSCALILLTAETVHPQFGLERYQADQRFKNGSFSQALDQYKTLLDKNVNDPEINYNAGNALYRLQKYDDALKYYQRALENTQDTQFKNRILYNMANAQFKRNKLQESADLYKQVLRHAPDDKDAKFNYEYLLKLMKQNPPPPQKSDSNNDKNKQQEQNKDQQQNKNKKDNKNTQQQDKKDPDKKNNKEQNSSGMSKKEAEKILDLLKNQEKEYQRKNIKEKAHQEQKTDIDW